jgi:hypothetical protein
MPARRSCDKSGVQQGGQTGQFGVAIKGSRCDVHTVENSNLTYIGRETLGGGQVRGCNWGEGDHAIHMIELMLTGK